MNYRMTTKIRPNSKRKAKPLSSPVKCLQNILQTYFPDRKFKAWAVKQAEEYVAVLGYHDAAKLLNYNCASVQEEDWNQMVKADTATANWSKACREVLKQKKEAEETPCATCRHRYETCDGEWYIGCQDYEE